MLRCSRRSTHTWRARRYESLDAAALRQLCGRYPEMLRAKDVEMQAEIPGLLQRVVEAERPPLAIAPR